MQKKIIALAIAGALAAPLAAQADVKISGQLQAEIASMSGDGINEGLYVKDASEAGSGNQNAGTAGTINISISEDLGGGLTAVAKKGIHATTDNADTGGAINDRDGYVGLSGGFGTVLVGNMNSPYKGATVKWDPFLATSAQARGNAGVSGLHNGYANDAIAYANNFGGVKLVAAIVVDESPDGTGSTNGDHGMSFGINAPVGPVEVALAYFDNGATDGTATKVGVKWAQDAIAVSFQYEMLDAAATGLFNAGSGESTFMNITATMDMGSGNTLAVAYGMNDGDVADTSATYMALGMNHAFSKTTKGYVAYRATSSDVAATDEAGIIAGLRVGF